MTEDEEVRSFVDALRRAERWVTTVPDVVGVAEGVDDAVPCITVFVSSDDARTRLPKRLGPWRVVIQSWSTATR